ncbi:riboflavin synthase subunit alpha [Thaumasiovibrio subtropicus]|uniref:riboflavin synthase subunit alpha n=1 Tax=Thaumasiovibrio subtropicus TaxID=1891207 RepID=UPI000B35FB5E|nr:riboflavin synthase subunit alpha [Thaumasiovibrio subtropicus]
MFTGIVHSAVPIAAIEEKADFRRHAFDFSDELLEGLVLGASVANNGCCLTVAEISGSRVSFDLIDETLEKTNLDAVTVGSAINIERAAKFGDEIGGHLMSGHIIDVATVVSVVPSENNLEVVLRVAPCWAKYILPKGFVGVNGISLTVGRVEENQFSLHIIPETIARTNIGEWQVGDKINLEIDPQTQAVVDTVERVMDARSV